MTTVAEPRPHTAAPVRRSLGDLYDLAERLAGATVLPPHLRGNPANVLVHLMAAEDLGPAVSEYAALTRLYPSSNEDGQPDGGLGMRSDLARSIAHAAGYDIDYEDWDANACTAVLTHPDGSEDRFTYTRADAEAANLFDPGYRGSSYWHRHTRQMLGHRAVMNCLGFHAPWLLAGVSAMDETAHLAPIAPQRSRTQAGVAAVVAQAAKPEPEPTEAPSSDSAAPPASPSPEPAQPAPTPEPEPEPTPEPEEKPEPSTSAAAEVRPTATVRIPDPEPTSETRATALWESVQDTTDRAVIEQAITDANTGGLMTVTVPAEGTTLRTLLYSRKATLPAATPAPKPEPVKPAPKKRVAKPKPANESEPEAKKSTGVDLGSVDPDSPQARAAELWEKAQGLTEPKEIGALFASASASGLSDQVVDGMALRTRLTDLARNLPKPNVVPACSCNEIELAANAGVHANECPKAAK
ncbi:hypothetical protein ACODT5_28740 [Streptomyces sp. 5.8]|uniref:hypothetical protein n=1 Tax=Streptomyces sp. 5.8 TaxID=3406571 RepID=UPI003BB5D487